MEIPLVSVIIASKNRAHYIGEAIESVLKQDYTSHEILVVDKASTDGTEKIVTSYPNVLLIQQSGNGIADAWNTGIEKSRGEFIAFIDTDDIWATHKLLTQVEYLISHPEIQYVVSRLKYFLQPGSAVPANFKQNLLEDDHVALLPQALFARKKLFKEIGAFNTSLRIANDFDWFVRAKDKKIPMAVIQEVLLYKRVHMANTSNGSVSINNKELLQVLKKSIAFNRNKYPITDGDISNERF